MEIIRLGKIFNPSEHKLTNNCHDYAQSPQSLVFDNYIRIYFSSREKEANGKFKSHVCYVDFSKNLKEIIKVSRKTVISLGPLGSFDEHGIFPLNIFKDENKILGFSSGISRRKAVSVETSIGFSESFDHGETFQKKGIGPIMTSNLNEPFMVGDPFVLKHNNVFFMWYIFGTKWISSSEEQEPDRVYKIAQAHSSDGLNWIRNGKKIIPSVIDENECQALPTVIRHKGKFHMIFCFRNVHNFRNDSKNSYRLGYAQSTNLINWDRDDNVLDLETKKGDWDHEMQCYPHLFKTTKNIFLLYNGNNFGKYGFGAAVIKKL